MYVLEGNELPELYLHLKNKYRKKVWDSDNLDFKLKRNTILQVVSSQTLTFFCQFLEETTSNDLLKDYKYFIWKNIYINNYHNYELVDENSNK